MCTFAKTIDYMKRLIILIAVLFVPATLAAQKGYPTETLEVEVGGGFITGFNSASVPYTMGGGLRLFGEVRFNDYRTPIDIGLQYNFGVLWRSKGDTPTHYSYNIMTTMVDYEFARGKHFSPFVGVGVGLAFVDTDRPGFRHMGRAVCFNPRIGFEFHTHYRLTIDAKIMTSEYSFFSIGFGYVFGGYPTEYSRPKDMK